MKTHPTLTGVVRASLLFALIAVVTAACAPPQITSAKLYMNNKDYVNARRSLEEAIQIYPDNAEAYYILATLEATESNWAEAKTNWDRSASLSPIFRAQVERDVSNWWLQHYNDGFTFIQRQDYESAESSFLIATMLDPENPEAWEGLAVVYGQQRRYDEAIEMYGKVLELNPDDDTSRLNLGLLYYNSGNYMEAVRYLDPLQEDNIDDSVFVETLGYAYRQLDERDKARALYENSLESNPENLYTHMQLAIMYTETDQDDLALPHFITVLELNPFDTEALNNIAITYMESEREAEAIPYLEKSKEINPNSPMTWLRLGGIYMRMGVNAGDQEMIRKGQEHMQRAEELQALMGDPPPVR